MARDTLPTAPLLLRRSHLQPTARTVGFGTWHAGDQRRRRKKRPATCGEGCSATTLWGWARGPRARGMGHRNRRWSCLAGRRGRGFRNRGTVGGRTRPTGGGSPPHRRLWGSRSRTLGSPPRGSPLSTGSPLSLGSPQSRGSPPCDSPPAPRSPRRPRTAVPRSLGWRTRQSHRRPPM